MADLVNAKNHRGLRRSRPQGSGMPSQGQRQVSLAPVSQMGAVPTFRPRDLNSSFNEFFGQAASGIDAAMTAYQEESDRKATTRGLLDAAKSGDVDPEYADNEAYKQAFREITAQQVGGKVLERITAETENLPTGVDPQRRAAEVLSQELSGADEHTQAAIVAAINPAVSKRIAQVQANQAAQARETQKQAFVPRIKDSMTLEGSLWNFKNLVSEATPMFQGDRVRARGWVMQKMAAQAQAHPEFVETFVNLWEQEDDDGLTMAQRFPEAYVEHVLQFEGTKVNQYKGLIKDKLNAYDSEVSALLTYGDEAVDKNQQALGMFQKGAMLAHELRHYGADSYAMLRLQKLQGRMAPFLKTVHKHQQFKAASLHGNLTETRHEFAGMTKDFVQLQSGAALNSPASLPHIVDVLSKVQAADKDTQTVLGNAIHGYNEQYFKALDQILARVGGSSGDVDSMNKVLAMLPDQSSREIYQEYRDLRVVSNRPFEELRDHVKTMRATKVPKAWEEVDDSVSSGIEARAEIAKSLVNLLEADAGVGFAGKNIVGASTIHVTPSFAKGLEDQVKTHIARHPGTSIADATKKVTQNLGVKPMVLYTSNKKHTVFVDNMPEAYPKLDSMGNPVVGEDGSIETLPSRPDMDYQASRQFRRDVEEIGPIIGDMFDSEGFLPRVFTTDSQDVLLDKYNPALTARGLFGVHHQGIPVFFRVGEKIKIGETEMLLGGGGDDEAPSVERAVEQLNAAVAEAQPRIGERLFFLPNEDGRIQMTWRPNVGLTGRTTEELYEKSKVERSKAKAVFETYEKQEDKGLRMRSDDEQDRRLQGRIKALEKLKADPDADPEKIRRMERQIQKQKDRAK